MTEKERKLVMKDLCRRLQYRPFAFYRLLYNRDGIEESGYCRVESVDTFRMTVDTDCGEFSIDDIKLCFRRMDDAAKSEMDGYWDAYINGDGELYDWLDEHHFDHRGLIGLGLAMDAGDIIRMEICQSVKSVEPNPCFQVVHLEMVGKDGKVLSEKDCIGMLKDTGKVNEMHITLIEADGFRDIRAVYDRLTKLTKNN